MTSDSILALDCWLRGDTIDRMFTVEISNMETVAALKISIKNQALVDLQQLNISLYAVSVPVEMDGEELQNKLATTAFGYGLGHRVKLSEVFTPSRGKKWIVIVNAPELVMAVCCWLRGDPIDNIIVVRIPAVETVAALKESIKEKLQMNFPANAMTLHKVSIPYDDDLSEALERLELSPDTRLKALDLLSSIFVELPPQHVHIVIERPTPDQARNLGLPISINCWLRGDSIYSVFVVTIPAVETVVALKESIKEKLQMNFPANAMTLHKVSIPCDDDLSEALERLELSPDTRLKALDLLSSIFVELPPQHVHIVIERPTPDQAGLSISINCWLRGDSIYSVFVVHILAVNTVTALRESIKERKPTDFRDIDADDMILYKVMIPWNDDVPETLARLEIGPDARLNGWDVLSDVFTGVLPRQHIHVIIDSPNRHPSWVFFPSLSPSHRATFLSDLPAEDPLSAGVSEVFFARQQKRKQSMLCNRPCHAQATIPVTLLHPAFGEFLDDCETYNITPEDSGLALRLHVTMADYDDEWGPHSSCGLAQRIRNIFDHWNLHFIPSTIAHSSYITDGDLSVKDHRYAIISFQNEIGSHGAEPYNQAVLCYLESTREYAENSRSCLPCILILLFGPYISFVGAAWNNNRPVFQTLSSMLPMHYHDTDTKMHTIVARHLGALRKMTHTLKLHYEDLTNGSLARSDDFPYPTRFTSLKDKVERQFTYTMQPFEDKLIFFGTMDDYTHPICIKFVHGYSKEAHQTCESLGCAPKPHGLEELAGGWLMVIMDKLLPKEYVALHKMVPSPSLISNIRATLAQIHRMNYVHGDIRDGNIMVSMADTTKFMLIDFDWAGKINEVRYPMNVTKLDKLWRPESVEDEALILADHDMAMLDKIARRV